MGKGRDDVPESVRQEGQAILRYCRDMNDSSLVVGSATCPFYDVPAETVAWQSYIVNYAVPGTNEAISLR